MSFKEVFYIKKINSFIANALNKLKPPVQPNLQNNSYKNKKYIYDLYGPPLGGGWFGLLGLWPMLIVGSLFNDQNLVGPTKRVVGHVQAHFWDKAKITGQPFFFSFF